MLGSSTVSWTIGGWSIAELSLSSRPHGLAVNACSRTVIPYSGVVGSRVAASEVVSLCPASLSKSGMLNLLRSGEELTSGVGGDVVVVEPSGLMLLYRTGVNRLRGIAFDIAL
jgi:hypothetical protein